MDSDDDELVVIIVNDNDLEPFEHIEIKQEVDEELIEELEDYQSNSDCTTLQNLDNNQSNYILTSSFYSNSYFYVCFFYMMKVFCKS